MTAPRQTFDKELHALQDHVREMGQSVHAAIGEAVDALERRDAARGNAVKDGDRKINRMEIAIHDECARLIATEQPVARDLRIIMAMIKAALELERIGDYAVNIARAAVGVAGLQVPQAVGAETAREIASMAEKAKRMTTEAVDSILEGNAARAEANARLDDEMDAAYSGFLRTRIHWMSTNPEAVDWVLHFLFAAKHLERIADHAVNLCELAFYVENGENRELSEG